VVRLSLISLCLLVGASCVRVAPYQRGHLADPSMETSHENAETRFRAHVHDSREGATGGYGSSGGGCGCN
jgi:hypothetical protein